MAYLIGAATGLAIGLYPSWLAVTGIIDWQRGDLEKRNRTKVEVLAQATFGFGMLGQAAYFVLLALNSN